MEEILQKITDFADRAHADQKRKYTPEPYIVHPLRVMKTCREYLDTLPVLTAALLHDVLEDTQVTKEELHSFLLTLMNERDATTAINLVVDLTDIYTKKNYGHWNRAKRRKKEAERIEKISAEAQTIKYADIIDNCTEISKYDPDFAPVFLKECKMLLRHMQKGKRELFEKAVEVIKTELNKLPAPDAPLS